MDDTSKQSPIEMEDEVTALERELEQAKAELERAKIERENRQRPEKLKAERERIARLTRNEQVFGDLEAEHGINRLRRVDTEDGRMIVVRRPAPVAFKRFQQSKTNVDDCDALVRTCLVYPSRDEYTKIIEDYPAKTVESANAASELAGIRRRELEGK